MRGTARQIIAVMVVALTLGLHWAALQTVAWTGMLIVRSQHTSLREAVASTFDGQHPCVLCEVVRKGRADEQKQEQERVQPNFKLEPGLVWQEVAFDFAGAQLRIPSPDVFGLTRAEQPPKPRPRGTIDNHARA